MKSTVKYIATNKALIVDVGYVFGIFKNAGMNFAQTFALTLQVHLPVENIQLSCATLLQDIIAPLSDYWRLNVLTISGKYQNNK